MIDSTPVGRITSALEGAGYLRLPQSLLLGGLKLDFPAAFVHQKSSTELILVADTASDDETLLARKMSSVARALDVSRSRRSLTLVLAGPRPKPSTLEYLGKVCRVLPIGNATGTEADIVVHNWLAVLLPLTLPHVDGAVVDPLSRVRNLAGKLDGPLRLLIDAAAQGEKSVQRDLHQLIDEASRGLEDQDI